MPDVYLFDGAVLRPAPSPAKRPLRYAAWSPAANWALLCGNRGEAWRFGGETYEPLQTNSQHNLRGADWSPDGSRALLAGNRGAVLHFDGDRFEELPSPTVENLRRVAWSPDGASALIVGNGGTVLRFDAASGALIPLPGDRAHTMRSVAWRPDGAYALIGAYASAYAGYPRPHMLYRCDGRYTQALLATDDEDDAVAVSWRPGEPPARALVLVVAYGEGDRVSNKLFEYDGTGFGSRAIEAPAALLGAGWSAAGDYALACGERGTLLRFADGDVSAIATDTTDNLVGPFWRPTGAPLAIVLRGPTERVFTV